MKLYFEKYQFLESSWLADFRTAIGCQIQSRFHKEKGQKLVSQSKILLLYNEILNIIWKLKKKWNVLKSSDDPL